MIKLKGVLERCRIVVTERRRGMVLYNYIR